MLVVISRFTSGNGRTSRALFVTPFAFDTETDLIKIGLLAPPLTCLTWVAGESKSGHLEWVGDSGLKDKVRGWLLDPNLLFVGLNTAFDLAVVAAEWPDLLPLVFQAYSEDRVTDVGLRQKLVDIARGQFRGYTDAVTERHTKYEYSLAAIMERLFKMRLEKSEHRLSFGPLRGVHPSQWPEGAREYAVGDAEATMRIYYAQKTHEGLLRDEFRQARAAFGLHLISCWGIRTSEKQIDKFCASVEKEYEAALALCKEHGLVRPNGKRDTKKARTLMLEVMAELEEAPKKTPAFIKLRRKRDAEQEELTKADLRNLQDPIFGISVDEEACLASADDRLIAYSQVTSLTTVVDTHIPNLRNGVKYPIQPRFDPLMETGRTSCKGHDARQSTNGYQMHNVRRLPGIRECFTAREGTVYVDADYSGLELHTWAQSCIWALGESELAKALNAKIDPHLVLAATMMNASYEETKERYKAGEDAVAGPQGSRQFAKIGNFGFQGGMSAETFRSWARQQYKTKFSREQADFIRESWYQTWPEAESYFNWIQVQCGQGGGVATIEQWLSGRIRGLIPFTVASNTFFQGLGADATKDALFAIQRECYVDRYSPLFGSRMVNYVHDNFMLETPEEAASEAADRLVKVMIEVGTRWLPDVPPRAEVTVSRHWSKKAKAVRNKEGKLIPWEDSL